MENKTTKNEETVKVDTADRAILPFVSILMVNFNGKVHLKEFFESVFNLNYPRDRFEVVVIDNASSDGSPEWIKENYPEVKQVILEKNTGFAIGNNIGANYCQGKFIALINNDTVLDKEWLIELIKQAIKAPDAIYGSKMLWYRKRDYVVYGGGRLFAWGDCCHLQCYAKNVHEREPSLTMYADGCGVLLSKEIFQKIGGFEESYFCYCEDYELSWKAWLLGYKVYFVPTAEFYHKVSSTLGGRSHAYIYLLWRNQLRNIIKFAEPGSLTVMLPLFTGYAMAMYLVVYCIQERNFSLVLPLAKAYGSIISDMPRLLKVRKEFQKNRKIRDKELKKLGLIMSFKKSIGEALSTLNRKSKFSKVTAV